MPLWISREMAPLGPPVFEKLLVWRCKRVILDVDDALHVFDKESSSLLPRLLRDRGKFSRMAASYTSIVCGNAYLADFYRQHGGMCRLFPPWWIPSLTTASPISLPRRYGSDGSAPHSTNITWNFCVRRSLRWHRNVASSLSLWA